MTRLFKLINFEFNRIFKILLVLLISVVTIQMVGTVKISLVYLNEIQHALEMGMSIEEIHTNYGQISFQRVTGSLWFVGPIFLGIVSVLFYIFLIWYRDWYGKNTFIYRLLTLPTERINIYLAKLVTILLMTLSFVSIQIIAMPLEIKLMSWIVPEQHYIHISAREALTNHIELSFIFKSTFTEFAIWYGIGIISVAMIFTGILFERSYRLLGIGLGIGYIILSVLLFLMPVWIQIMLDDYFYPDELYKLFILSALVVFALSTWTASYLLRKKIRV